MGAASEHDTFEALNMRLLAQCDLGGFGNGGEGLALQAAGGRRILYVAHETAPKNFTGVDVSDPRRPHVVIQTELPRDGMRSNSLSLAGDLLAVAYQCEQPGGKPAGLELFDVSRPEVPRSISFFDTSGPQSRGAHFVWFVDGEFAYLSTGMPDFEPTHPKDDQIVVILDLRDPVHPIESGRWWLPGTRKGDAVSPPGRHPIFDMGFRAHNVNVYPERPDRAYVGYIDAGVIILDLADRSRPRLVSRLDYHPPMPGFTHTVLPLFERGLLAVSDEANRTDCEDQPKLVWILDAHLESSLLPIATVPLDTERYCGRGGRFGAHNLHENLPVETSLRSESVIYGSFFNGGVRAFDISNPFRPEEVAYLVPPAPSSSRYPVIQINDVYVDESGLIYAVDRFGGGLYVAEQT